jgi:hypothetical protein
MFSADFILKEMVMTDTRPQLASEASISRAAAVVAANLLIFVGIVFQLGQLGYGGLRADSFWVIRMIAADIWELLAARFNAPSFTQILEFWPLALVGLGLMILVALKPERVLRRN